MPTKERERVDFGRPTRRGDGHIGVRAFVRTGAHGWSGKYAFDTHGKSSSATNAEIATWREHHRKKAGLLDSLRDIGTETFSVGSETWRILGVTIREVGQNVELFVLASPLNGERLDKTRTVTVSGIYPSIDGVPDADAIRRAIHAAAEVKSGESALHAEFVAKVNALAGGQ